MEIEFTLPKFDIEINPEPTDKEPQRLTGINVVPKLGVKKTGDEVLENKNCSDQTLSDPVDSHLQPIDKNLGEKAQCASR